MLKSYLTLGVYGIRPRGAVLKGLVTGLEALEIKEQLKTIQTTSLRSSKIFRTVLETW